MISSSTHPDSWKIPGGKIEPKDENVVQISAMREAFEESGAVGLIGRSLGTYEKSAKRKRTKVFVMYVKALVDDFEEKDVKNRKWFSLDEAQRVLGTSRPFQAKCLEALKSS